MAKKKQWRRSVSMQAEAFATLAAHCRAKGVSLASYVQAAAMEKAKSEGARVVPRDEALSLIRGEHGRNKAQRDAAAVAAMPPSLVEF